MVDGTTIESETRALLPMMYRVSMNIVCVEDDAQDAMQQALTKAWEKRETANPAYFRVSSPQ